MRQDKECNHLFWTAFEADIKANKKNEWNLNTMVLAQDTELDRILFLIAAIVSNSNKFQYRRRFEFDEYGYNTSKCPYYSSESGSGASSTKEKLSKIEAANKHSLALLEILSNIEKSAVEQENEKLKELLKDLGYVHLQKLVQGLVEIQRQCLQKRNQSSTGALLNVIESVKEGLDESLEAIRNDEESINDEQWHSKQKELKKLNKRKNKHDTSGSEDSDDDSESSSDDDILGIDSGANKHKKNERNLQIKREKLNKLRQTKFLVLLGKAQLSFISGDYEDSLTSFKELLLKFPQTCPPYIHLGIGHCCLKLKEYDIARYAYQRAKSMVCVVYFNLF